MTNSLGSLVLLRCLGRSDSDSPLPLELFSYKNKKYKLKYTLEKRIFFKDKIE